MATIVRRRQRPAPCRAPEDHPLYDDLMGLGMGLDLLQGHVYDAEAAIHAGDDDALEGAVQMLCEGEGSAVPSILEELLTKFGYV